MTVFVFSSREENLYIACRFCLMGCEAGFVYVWMFVSICLRVCVCVCVCVCVREGDCGKDGWC